MPFEDRTVPVTISIPRRLADRLRMVAEDRGISASSIARIAIEKELNRGV